MDNYSTLCKSGSYAICNLFLPTLESSCKLETIGGTKNLVNVIVTSISLAIMVGLLLRIKHKKAAVGRKEMILLLLFICFQSFFHMLVRAQVFPQDSIASLKFSSFYLAWTTSTAFVLLFNALVAFQFWRDGSKTSIITLLLISIGIISGLTSFNVLKSEAYLLNDHEKDETSIQDVAYFIFYTIFPILAILLYLILQFILVIRSLSARKPLSFLLISFVFLIAGKCIDYYAGLNLCLVSKGLMDGAPFDSICFTFSILSLFKYWNDITEDDWDDFKIAA
ncbi:hypothetical protein K502DRAFT_332293 [Neoconidiobolus thromboides FSU 785]|nr:hypothetical protein K502DRAFT_332293 [Neoconidiobolus thromboides FSU 785]